MTDGRPGLGIVVVTFQNIDVIEDCLASLLGDVGPEDEVVVVDNGSTDGTPELVADKFPEVILDATGENLGFARGCNRGAVQTTAGAVLLLNPDTVVHHGCLDALRDVATRRPSAGMWGGRTLDASGQVDWRSCQGLATVWSSFCFATLLSTIFPRHPLFDPESLGRWDRDDEREVGMIVGCLLMVDRSLWVRLGGFDESYFMYGEDSDLAIRARSLGARPTITPSAVITHFIGGSSTSDHKRVLLLRGKVAVARGHSGPVRGKVMVALLMLGVWLRASLYRVSRRGAAGSSWQNAWDSRAEWSEGYPSRRAQQD